MEKRRVQSEEEGIPRLKDSDVEKAATNWKAKTEQGVKAFHRSYNDVLLDISEDCTVIRWLEALRAPGAEHEDLRVKPLFFHGSDESIVTPVPDSDLDHEQLRVLLPSPLYLQEREANAERSQVYHSQRENLMSSSSQDPTSTGKLVALFSRVWLDQETFSE